MDTAASHAEAGAAAGTAATAAAPDLAAHTPVMQQ
jgi:hypothetical protein